MSTRDPSAQEVYEHGGVHDSAGRAEEAIPLYERALELGLPPELVPRALVQLGSSLRNVGRTGEAASLLSEARVKYPEDAAVAVFRAFVLIDQGRAREAALDLLELVRTRLDTAELRRYARSIENYTRELAERGEP